MERKGGEGWAARVKLCRYGYVIIVCLCVQMFATSKSAFGFVLLFHVVSFLCLFPISLFLRLPFVLT